MIFETGFYVYASTLIVS